MTKFFARIFLMVGLLFTAVNLSAQDADYSRISLRLADQINANPHSRQPIRVGIELISDLDLHTLDLQLYAENALPARRASVVINALKNEANNKQPAFIQFLATVRGTRLSTLERFWISNVLFIDATPRAIELISLHPGVSYIDIDAQLAYDEPMAGEPLPANGQRINSPGGHEQGHDAIGAPQMWSMGYSGLGRMAMSMDAGVEASHPALSYKWQGNFKPLAQSWFEYGNPSSTPYDCDPGSSHGTHTMGTMVGLDPATNDTIGVAPGARWIHSPSLCASGGTSANIAGFQWAMDPDNDPNTTSDMPDVINNSWYDPGTTNECNGLYRSTIDAVEAVGIAVVFSAGNSGSAASTITQPKNINNDTVSVFCVGATNKTAPYAIASFSSRGPSTCPATGSLLIKPEVSAPGVNVRSSQGTNAYGNLSGTSMAAPHACGAILLLKEAFPNLTGRQLKLAIYHSATDLGAPGEDNNYGMGMVNVPAAYNWLINKGFTPAPYNFDAGIAALYQPGGSTCGTSITPEIEIRNDGNSTLTSLTINYTINPGNITSTTNWTGNIPAGQSAVFTLNSTTLSPGNYTISILTSLPNGQPDERPYNDCLIRDFEVITGTQIPGVTIGCPGVATLNANQGSNTTVTWYANPTGGPSLGTGNTYTTPSISSNTTYYAELVSTDYGAKPDNTGGGGYFANDTRWNIFDALSDFTLKSVLVYANTAGNRTIRIYDAGNAQIHTITVNLPAGQSRVTLNWPITAGTGYSMRLVGTADLYRNNAGLNYPYVTPGILSVTGSNAGTPTGFYYFFYDWEIEYADACGRVPVTVTVGQFATAIQPSATQVDITINGTVNFTHNTGPSAAVSWNWDFGDGNTSTQQNPSHTYTAPGTYTVTLTVTDANGCTATSTVVITVIQSVGLDLARPFRTLDVFPNPNSGTFMVNLEMDAEWPLKLELFNSLGQAVVQSDFGPMQNLKSEINLKSQASGVYYLRISAGGETMVRKVEKR